MYKKYILLFFLCACYFEWSSAQVSVNPLTGAAQVNIPVYTISSGQVAIPVTLSYNGSGVKVKDVESTAGMGWQLNSGGQIFRIVHGLPDDVIKDTTGAQRLGWMSPLDTAANSIAGFTIANDGTTCSKETTDIAYINAHFPYRDDTEPDEFYVSAPGLSCRMVYDRTSSTFKPVAYQDLSISFTTDATSHLITTFTITNDKGISYVFGNTSTISPANNKVTFKTISLLVGVNPAYFTTKFWQYVNGVTFSDSWSLVKMTDVNGNGVQLNYSSPSPTRPSSDTLSLSVQGISSSIYLTSKTETPYTLQSIQAFNPYGTSSQSLNFSWTTSPTGQTIISGITGFGRNFQFTYSDVRYGGFSYAREFLRNFSDPGTNTPVNYQFAYAGEYYTGGTYKTNLPDSTSNSYDYWGYYTDNIVTGSHTSTVYVNPSHPAYPFYSIAASDTYYSIPLTYATRTADPANVATGSLTKVTSSQGGNTNIIYEPNDFYNVPSGTVVKGGGIRVKQIIDSTGVHSTNNIVQNFSYLDPSTGLSSGKPLSLPQYAFTQPGSGTGNTFYANATLLSYHDLSTEDHTIMYSYFKKTQTGAGSMLTHFYVPATYCDASAAPACSGCTADWAPTINYLGRDLCGNSYSPMANSTYAYPFIANPNYEFERGLPLKVTYYNDGGTEVRESAYTYQRSFTPTTIYAFRYDNQAPAQYNSATSYNKYKIFYGGSELTTKVVNKTYDSQGLGEIHADSSMYTYGSANHKLVTLAQSANSDGNIATIHINYVKDYAATAGSNANVTALANLKLKNINAPVESYQQITHAGVTKTTAASLTLFNGVTPGSTTLYLPWRQYKLIQPDGLAAFAPMTISGQTLTYDSTHYVRAANYDTYDKAGFPVTTDDNFKNISTTLMNHFAGQPAAVFSNTAYGYVAFADFEGDPASAAYGFTVSGSGSYTPVGSHAGTAKGIASTQTVTSVSLTKSFTAANYIFSIWINAAAAGTLTLTLTGITSHPTVSYTTGGWKYYELKIPVSTLSSSYTVSFTTSASISVDDILFYPDVATAATATYDPVSYYKIASTNTNGVSSYFTNDQWGRTTYIYDQDFNIVKKNIYVVPGEVEDYNNLSITAPGTVTAQTPATFGIQGVDNASGATVTWTFGDGSSPVNTSLTTSPSHTYIGTGTYTITAVVNSPIFGPKTVTKSQYVAPGIITLSFSNGLPVGAGNLSTLVFKQGGVTKYTFTPANISGATILQGAYIIIATISNPLAHTDYSFSLNGDCYFGCNNYTSATTLTFTYTADLSSCATLGAVMSTTHCGTPP